jgi:hypothetical protein
MPVRPGMLGTGFNCVAMKVFQPPESQAECIAKPRAWAGSGETHVSVRQCRHPDRAIRGRIKPCKLRSATLHPLPKEGGRAAGAGGCKAAKPTAALPPPSAGRGSRRRRGGMQSGETNRRASTPSRRKGVAPQARGDVRPLETKAIPLGPPSFARATISEAIPLSRFARVRFAPPSFGRGKTIGRNSFSPLPPGEGARRAGEGPASPNAERDRRDPTPAARRGVAPQAAQFPPPSERRGSLRQQRGDAGR